MLAACAALAACTSSGPSAPKPSTSSAPQHSSAPPNTPTGSPPPEVSDVAAVFIAVLGGAADPGSSKVRTYIRDSTVCSRILHQRPCRPVPIAQDVQDEVVAALGPRVVFAANPPGRLSPQRLIAVTLGAPKIDGDRATVTVETECGLLCGLGETVVLARTTNGWRRTGSTGPSWIS